MNTKINKELLFRYFSGLSTPLENSGIERWLERDGNEEVFFLYLEEWERTNAQYLPDKDAFFLKFRGELDRKVKRNHNPGNWYVTLINVQRKWWGIAAAFLIIICGAVLAKDWILYKNYSTQFGETMTIILDDESQVVLNANTSLKVPRWIGYSEDREVWMTGEAFFKVSKKRNHKKFRVHTDNLSVEVLGTRFNVTDRHQTTKVVLQEGKVKVVSNSDEGSIAMLEKAGDYAEVQNKIPEIITRRVDESLYTTWQEKRLKFNETPLPQVLQTIEDYYGVRVGSNDTILYNRKFSGTLPNNDLDIILQALSNIYGAEFKREINH